MSEFINVTIIKETSICFDGNVTSCTVQFEDGSCKKITMKIDGLLFDGCA